MPQKIPSKHSLAFLMPVTTQPRYKRRIKNLSEAGFNTPVLSFSREHLPEESLPGWIFLGNIKHGRYIQRLFHLARAIPQVRHHLRKVAVIYAFEFDMLALARFSMLGLNKKFVYELGDIRELMLENSLISRVMRAIERQLSSRCSAIVFIGKRMAEQYGGRIQGFPEEKIHVLRNRPDDIVQTEEFNHKQKALDPGQITIGYFGLLRCSWTLQVLERLIRSGGPDQNVVLRGSPLPNVESKIREMSEWQRVTVYGPYKAPHDLADIYGSVDIVWAAYPFSTQVPGNWQYASTNRFHEACFFGVPPIVREGEEQATIVESHDLGLVLTSNDQQEAASQLSSVTVNDIYRWRKNIRTFNDNNTKTDSYPDLVKAIFPESTK